MNEKESIKIWRFHDAPADFQDMSTSGGDEDWLALVPPSYKNEYLPFLEGDSFGCCSVDIIEPKGFYKGYTIFIGTHA